MGRTRELAALARLDRERPLVLVGEAGIGKTALIRAATARERDVHEGGGLASLSWKAFLPVARALGAQPPEGDSAAAAHWVVEAVGDGVLVLDDLHWADPQTLDLLPHLAGRVRLLAAIRAGDPGTARALAATEKAGLEQLVVDPLSREESDELLLALRPDLPEDARTTVGEEARGNPFLLEELSAAPEPTTSLRLALGARLRRCSEEAREGMALLGLLGRPAERELVPGADELVAAGLVTDGDALAPRHAVLAEAAVEALTPDRRTQFHSALAARLRDPGESARHHLAAGEREAAHHKALAAAETASRYQDRARHLGIAAEAADGEGADELRLRAAAAMVDIGDLAAVERLAERVGGSTPGTLAELALCRSRAAFAGGDFERARSELTAGESLVRGTGLHVEVRIAVEDARQRSWDLGPDTLEQAEHALRLARATGAPEGHALTALATALYVVLSPDAVDVAREAYEVARREDDRDAELDAGLNLVSILHTVAGDGDAAYRLADELVQRAWAIGFLRLAAEIEVVRACVAFWVHGDTEHSIAEIERLLSDPALATGRDAAAWGLVLALAYTGRVDDAREVLERETDASQSLYGRSALVAATIESAWLTGDLRHAVATAERFWAGDGADAGLNKYDAAVAEAWACWELGIAAPRRGVSPVPGVALLEAAHDELTAVSSLSDADNSEELFDRAADSYARMYRGGEVRTRWGAAEAALLSGANERARRRLLEVEEQSAAFGFEPLTRRIRRSLRKVGVQRQAAARPANGGLSRREREVLTLVGRGLTTNAIADRLGISRSTVDSHVARATAKLGARSRVHAAALAAQLDR